MKSKLDDIFANDELNLLDLPESKKTVHVERNLITRRFDEIVAFYEENGRLPSKDGDLKEKKLYARLAAMRKDKSVAMVLKDYDMHGLLSDNSDDANGIDTILESDNLGLLSDDADIDGIYKMRHVKPSERIDPDYIAQRKRCVEFDEKYKGLFEQVITELNYRKRNLVEFSPKELEEGRFYVLRGMLLYLEKDDSSLKDYDFSTGSKIRRDGRTRCIFANGTEAPLLYRSVAKALQKDGFAISDIHENCNVPDTITEEDVQNGYIYVLKSQSTKPEIQEIKNLYKIGFCSGDVHDRIKNAANEPTYLMSGVTIILTARCYNMNARILEDSIHKFFGKSNANFTVTDRSGVIHHPREWFIVPLDIIENAIQLIKENKMDQYRYEPELNAIIKLQSE